jgi:hypothetical protein
MLIFLAGLAKLIAMLILSILKLKDDIKNSVVRSGGYIEDLRNNTDLQTKFVAAI